MTYPHPLVTHLHDTYTQVLAGISNNHCDHAAVISLRSRSSNAKKMRTNTYPLFSTTPHKFESVRYGIRYVNTLTFHSPCHRSYTARSIPTYAHPSYAAIPDKGRLYAYGMTSGTHSDRRHMFYSRTASQKAMGCSVCSQLRTSGFPRPHSVSI